MNLPSTIDREQDLEYWLEPAGCDQAPILRFWDDLVEEVTGEIRTTAILPREIKRLKWAWMSYQPAGAPDYVEGKGWLIGTGQCPFGTCMDRDPIPEYGDSQMFARHLVEFHGFAKRWYSCRRKSNSSRDCVVNGTPFGTSRKGCMVRHQKDVHHRSLEEILGTLDLIDYYSPAFNLTESQHMKRFPGYVSVDRNMNRNPYRLRLHKKAWPAFLRDHPEEALDARVQLDQFSHASAGSPKKTPRLTPDLAIAATHFRAGSITHTPHTPMGLELHQHGVKGSASGAWAVSNPETTISESSRGVDTVVSTVTSPGGRTKQRPQNANGSLSTVSYVDKDLGISVEDMEEGAVGGAMVTTMVSRTPTAVLEPILELTPFPGGQVSSTCPQPCLVQVTPSPCTAPRKEAIDYPVTGGEGPMTGDEWRAKQSSPLSHHDQSSNVTGDYTSGTEMDTDSHPLSFHSLDGDDMGLGDFEMLSPSADKSSLTPKMVPKVMALPTCDLPPLLSELGGEEMNRTTSLLRNQYRSQMQETYETVDLAMGLCIKAAEEKGRAALEAEQSAEMAALRANHNLEMASFRSSREEAVSALREEIRVKSISLEAAQTDLQMELDAHSTLNAELHTKVRKAEEFNDEWERSYSNLDAMLKLAQDNLDKCQSRLTKEKSKRRKVESDWREVNKVFLSSYTISIDDWYQDSMVRADRGDTPRILSPSSCNLETSAESSSSTDSLSQVGLTPRTTRSAARTSGTLTSSGRRDRSRSGKNRKGSRRPSVVDPVAGEPHLPSHRLYGGLRDTT